jgi:hypothetical protein
LQPVVAVDDVLPIGPSARRSSVAAITYRVGNLEILCYAQAHVDGRWQPKLSVTRKYGTYTEEASLELPELHDDPSPAQLRAFDAAVERYGMGRPATEQTRDQDRGEVFSRR